MADLIETYYMEHVKKSNEVDEFFYTQAKFAFEHGDHNRMEGLFERIIEYVIVAFDLWDNSFTKNENHEISRLLALRYQSQ